MESVGTPMLWVGFGLAIAAMLAIDLGVVHRRAHEPSPREAALWSGIWISVALLFNLFVWARSGSVAALEFLTGYVIEKALSVDNLFVFLLLFRYFRIPQSSQHRVLFWGILGAIFLRGLFVFLGVAILSVFQWAIYVFGAFLVLVALKFVTGRGTEVHPDRNLALRLLRRVMPIAPAGVDGSRFFVRVEGRRHATHLFAALITVEATDVVFAVDSIPAIFGVTRDPFLVYTSNIFAILGLRALYFLLAHMMVRWRYLDVALALILGFIGVKMLVSHWVHVPVGVSLAIIATVLVLSGVASALKPPREPVR